MQADSSEINDLEKLPTEIHIQISTLLGLKNLGIFASTSQRNAVVVIEALKIKQKQLANDIQFSVTKDAIFCYTEKNLYAWGSNLFGRLGLNEVHTSINFTQIPLDKGIGNIKQVLCGAYFSLLLTDKGLYVSGQNPFQAIGFDEAVRFAQFTKVPDDVIKKIRCFLLNENYSYIITAQDEIYGSGIRVDNDDVTKKIRCFLLNENYSYIITAQDEIYGSGIRVYNDEGKPMIENRYFAFSNLTTTSERKLVEDDLHNNLPSMVLETPQGPITCLWNDDCYLVSDIKSQDQLKNDFQKYSNFTFLKMAATSSLKLAFTKEGLYIITNFVNYKTSHINFNKIGILPLELQTFFDIEKCINRIETQLESAAKRSDQKEPNRNDVLVIKL